MGMEFERVYGDNQPVGGMVARHIGTVAQRAMSRELSDSDAASNSPQLWQLLAYRMIYEEPGSEQELRGEARN